ncbi:hypothetical protein JD844_022408 [Phrynosoma platyrhinos]|uniref:Uncharacterized protein n=1 Tax=Phrynosoma platyrhinos TaxID=52577 RepID=A0ABQ7SVD7_PHRPL|nr:hypothetical protein JD844_022408 [Phrynosoma platyrhinos]
MCEPLFHFPTLCSMPPIVDLLDSKELLETSVDKIAGFPPAGGSTEALEETNLSFSPHGTRAHSSEKADPVVVAEDPSLKLKQPEVELSPVLVSQSNININVNKQEEVVKLTEKCLNNAMESPVSTSVRLPPDIKSNILKAQAEAGHKVTREDGMSGTKNTNIQDAATRSILLSGKLQNSPLRPHSPAFLESREGLKMIQVSNAFVLFKPLQISILYGQIGVKNGILTEQINLESWESTQAQNSPEDIEILLTSQTENLIDFTEAIPRVSSPPTIVPRWLVPSGLVSNGPLGNDIALALKAAKGSSEALSVLTGSPPTLYTPEIMPRVPGYGLHRYTSTSLPEMLPCDLSVDPGQWGSGDLLRD